MDSSPLLLPRASIRLPPVDDRARRGLCAGPRLAQPVSWAQIFRGKLTFGRTDVGWAGHGGPGGGEAARTDRSEAAEALKGGRGL